MDASRRIRSPKTCRRWPSAPSCGGGRNQNARRDSLGLPQRADVVHDVPDVGVAHPRRIAFHVGGLRDAFFDHGEDLAVASAVVPLLVGHVLRGNRTGGARAVARAFCAVTLDAEARVRSLARRDRLGARGHGILDLRRFRIPTLLRHRRRLEKRGERAHDHSAMHRYLISRNSSIPYFDPSRPRPDSFMPPNGATSVEMMPVLMPTMPYSSASATRQMRPTSRP